MRNLTVVIAGTEYQRIVETDLGQEKICLCCADYYPIDNEFWYFEKVKTKKNGIVRKPLAVCKGCYIEWYKPWRLGLKKRVVKSTYQATALKGSLAA